MDSSSYGLSAGVTLLSAVPVTVAAQPVAAYPAGPATGSVASLSTGVANAGAVSVAANGDPLADTATGSSSVAGLSLLGGTTAAGGSGGLAFTGTPFLLVAGLFGGILLLLAGAGLVAVDRLPSSFAGRGLSRNSLPLNGDPFEGDDGHSAEAGPDHQGPDHDDAA